MTTTRRTFLKAVGATAAVLPLAGAAASCAGTGPGEGEGEGGGVDVGVDQFAAGLTADATDQLILGKDGGGIYAMTSICTHAACDLTQFGTLSATGISCSCHGSTYDANGVNTGGPAPAPLQHFKITLSADKKTATVDKSANVDATTRTAV